MKPKQKAKELVKDVGKIAAIYVVEEMLVVLDDVIEATGSSIPKAMLGDWLMVEKHLKTL